jgi:hypothetical protein
VGQGATERASVTYLGITNLVCRIRQQGDLLLEQRRRFEVVMARQGPDGDLISTFLYVRKARNPTDVDEHRRGGEPQLHQRHERMAAGNQLGLVAVLDQQGDCFFSGPRPRILECRRDHTLDSVSFWRSAAQARTAFTML